MVACAGKGEEDRVAVQGCLQLGGVPQSLPAEVDEGGGDRKGGGDGGIVMGMRQEGVGFMQRRWTVV